MVKREDIALYNVGNAINHYVTKMSKDDLEKYVRWNMKNYYDNVAEEDEGFEFCYSGRDTSVCIEEWKNKGWENKMEMKKVTIEQVDSWLSPSGTDWNKLEILEDLMNLANGEYKPEVLRDDILQGYNHSNYECYKEELK